MNDIALDCYYSLSSPWAYFAGPRLQDIVRRHPGVKLTFKPYDFQSVVPANGGIPIRTRPGPRRRYHQEELARWSEYLAMPIVLEPRHYPQGAHPSDPHWNKHAGWMLIAAQDQGLDVQPLSHALLRALWAEERDTALAEVRTQFARFADDHAEAAHGWHLRNALIPVVTLVALQMPAVFGGAIVTEQIFRIPGIGSLLIDAILANDTPVIMAVTFVFACLVVLFNLIADILYGWLDPRISFS